MKRTKQITTKGDSSVAKDTAAKPKRRAGRPDPLGRIWSDVAVPWLESAPDLPAFFIFERLMEEFPQLQENVRRTVERRVAKFRLAKGLPREVMFPQRVYPGRLGISDYTEMARHGIMIEGDLLDHLLYHFRMPYSGYEYASVVCSGESFASLSTGLQDALADLGGVPQFHRTDSLSAGFRNICRRAGEDLTPRYAVVCDDYGMIPTRNNRGLAHENGSVESSHGHLHRRISAELKHRGSCNFPSLDSYRAFIHDIMVRRNARRAKKIAEERKYLRLLPTRRSIDYDETFARVTSYSGITVRRVFYTVPSKYIGKLFRVEIHADRLDCYLNNKIILTLKRGRPGANGQRGFQIDYRHVIHSLRKKPGALLDLAYRDQLFPTAVYREIFDLALSQCQDQRVACRLMVDLLSLAHEQGCECELAEELAGYLARGELPKISVLRRHFHPDLETLPLVSVELPPLSDYDSVLLEHFSSSKENNND